LPQTFIEIELLGGQVEARRLRFPRINFLFQGDGFHDVLRLGCWFGRVDTWHPASPDKKRSIRSLTSSRQGSESLHTLRSRLHSEFSDRRRIHDLYDQTRGVHPSLSPL